MCLFYAKRLRALEARVEYLESRSSELSDWASLPEPADPFSRGPYVTPLSSIVQALLDHLGLELSKRTTMPTPKPRKGDYLCLIPRGHHDRA